MERRTVLNTALAAGAASLLAPGKSRTEDGAGKFEIIDTNVSLFRWPFRRLPLDDTDALVAKLRSLGITQAWAGSFEGILHRDLAGVNRRLAKVCATHTELVPIGSINPELPDWEDDLRRCVEDHGMPGIRLHPNYHGYTLEDPRLARLLERASDKGLLIQLAALIEDTRTQPAMVRVSDVDLSPLPKLMRTNPEAIVQILNYRPRLPQFQKLAEAPGIAFDTARVDGTDGVQKLLRIVPEGRVMFGTHAPFLIPEAALIRVHESDLSENELLMLLRENAGHFSNNLVP